MFAWVPASRLCRESRLGVTRGRKPWAGLRAEGLTLVSWSGPPPRVVFSPTRLSTLVLLAGWATLQMKVWAPEVLAGTVTTLLRE